MKTVRETLESGEYTYESRGLSCADLVTIDGDVLCYVRAAYEDWRPESENDELAAAFLKSDREVIQ